MTVIADLIRAGVAPELVQLVAEALAEERARGAREAQPASNARQERNARYYAKKAGERRLEASEQDGIKTIKTLSDAVKTPPVDGQKEIPPTPPKEKTTSLTNVREKSTRVRASEADFALLRNAYPKRIGGDPRETARKALDKALAGGASVEEIVDGARLFARFRAADDPKFTPMLATWLNRRGWADDYSEPPPRAGPLPRQSILAQIATGEIWHERDFNDIDIDSADRAEPRGFGFGRADEELSGAPGGPGKVLDFRRTGSGWG